MTERLGFKTVKERDDHLSQMVVSLFSSAEEETKPDRDRWRENFLLFDGVQEWGAVRKENEWMSRPFLHEFSVIIRDAASAAIEIVLQNSDFFNLKAKDEDREFASIMEKLILYYINKSGFYKNFYRYCLSGGITGLGIYKYTIQNFVQYTPEAILTKIDKLEKDQKQKLVGKVEGLNIAPETDPDKLEAIFQSAVNDLFGPTEGLSRDLAVNQKMFLCPELALVDPHNFFWQPDTTDINKSLFNGDRIYTTLAELDPYFNSKVYDVSKRERLIKSSGGNNPGGFSPNFMGSRDGQKWEKRNQYTNKNRFLKEIELLDYWGPIISKDGSLIESNWHVVVGNRKVILKAEPNPNFHQKHPYLISVFSPKPFKAVGAGVADNAVEQQKLINNITGLMVDMITMATYNAKVIDSSKIMDESQLRGGVKPGMLIEMTGRVDEAIAKVPLNLEVAPQAFQMLESLRLSGQKGASVQTQSANPASRARISATEVGLNQQRQNRSESTLAHELDVNLLEPFIEMTKAYVLQYGFESEFLGDMAAMEVISKEEFDLLDAIPRIERITEAWKSYDIEVRGFRSVLERNDHLSRFIEFLSVANQNPDLLKDVNKKYILTKIADALNLDVNQLIRQSSPTDQALEENALLATDRDVEVLPQDEHAAHLVVHYSIQGHSQASLSHIMQHLQLAQVNGVQVPPPPEELAGILGIAPNPTNTVQ